MSNNLPQKYKRNIFYNFFCYIKNLFLNNDNKSIKNKQINNLVSEQITQSNKDFSEQIKVKTNFKDKEYEKKKFMENLEENQELLESFSNDRLEEILHYYLDENEKKRTILKKLNA